MLSLQLDTVESVTMSIRLNTSLFILLMDVDSAGNVMISSSLWDLILRSLRSLQSLNIVERNLTVLNGTSLASVIAHSFRTKEQVR